MKKNLLSKDGCKNKRKI